MPATDKRAARSADTVRQEIRSTDDPHKMLALAIEACVFAVQRVQELHEMIDALEACLMLRDIPKFTNETARRCRTSVLRALPQATKETPHARQQ